MTATTVKSVQVTKHAARPVDLVSPGVLGGVKRHAQGVIEAATTSLDEIGDIIRMIRLPANVKLTALRLWSDDLDSDSALRVDIGLYKVNADETITVLDADCFATAVDATPVTGGATGGLDVLNEVLNIDQRGLPLWDMAAGVTADPGVPVEICLTVSTAGTSADAGTIVMEAEFTAD